MPNDYLVYAAPGTTDRVQYWSRATSIFGATFHYGAFPFDRQRLQFRISTEVCHFMSFNRVCKGASKLFWQF